MQSEFGHKMLDFRGGECLGEGVGDHVVCRAEYELNFSIVDYPADKVKMNVDMLGARMILMVLGKRDGGLIVRKEGDGLVQGDENFSNK